jgi:hypothetical protein
MTDNHDSQAWPALPFADWRETAETVHMWTQIVGKVRMVQSPWLNHAWHVTLYVTPRGMTTGTIPHGRLSFSVDFDFIDHRLIASASHGKVESLELAPMDTADFYAAVMVMLGRIDCPVTINVVPNEVADAIPFDKDRTHNAYDAGAVNRFWRALGHVDRVFNCFRAGFQGKASPVHFFWGSFDLAVTRFSGRTAPDHPGGLPNMPIWVAQEAYSQEVSSAGFWPGSADAPDAIFYSYAYPAPDGFDKADIKPGSAAWSADLGEFVLPYEVVRTADDPDAVLTDFLQTTFDAAADRAGWDLATLARRHFP